ncbi:MAG: Flp pilus assembly complex ATPase component TadA [Victivallales bacterium]|nr:Flp pilus assembly complex ATPase component TadA [Victivallales bacterium]
METEPHIFVERVICDALREGASDIFFLPEEAVFRVRVRVNGVQRAVAEVPHGHGEMCVAHIKSLAGLLTYRSKIAQDGVIRGIKDKHGDAKFANSELRVSTLPTICGERLAVRIVQEEESVRHIGDLGFRPWVSEALARILMRSSGLTILTGPTGCGKTTTIYAMIRELLRVSHDPASIITIEDPVECSIKGISQTSVSRGDAEWNYAKALRAALRHDVKTLVIGELRDTEVVKVALDAALTGHRVIATYHAGDIPSVFARMLHQGFEPFLVAAAISGVLAQRLVSSACSETRVPVAAVLEPDAEWQDFIAGNPAICEIRKRISLLPRSDIALEAEAMEKEGLITDRWRLEI